MELSEDDVIHILQLLSESDFTELHLEMGDLKFVVNKRGGPTPATQREFTSAHEAHAATTPASDRHDVEARPELVTAHDGFIPITSPILGIFYRAPKPGAPPFVEVGDVVDADTTVCIIEVMKLFTAIKAGQRGRIAEIGAENGQLVEYDQVLFWLAPHAEGQRIAE